MGAGTSMKRYGEATSIVTARLRSCRAAMRVISNAVRQECGGRLNNRAENSDQPSRRREKAMAKFRDTGTLQKFVSIHASVHNHLNNEHHLNRHETFKQDRAAGLAEWRHRTA
jgi:putative transposase